MSETLLRCTECKFALYGSMNSVAQTPHYIREAELGHSHFVRVVAACADVRGLG